MLYQDLRAEMFRQGCKMPDVAAAIGVSGTGTSLRFNGHRDFTTAEAYTILDLLGLPYADFTHYFPPNGIRGMELQPGLASA